MKKIAIIGRPNVGKSTLFNRLVGRRSAVVENQPGVTRDRLYGAFTHDNKSYTLIDTGGLYADPSLPLTEDTKDQTLKAVKETDLVFFLMDGRTGPLPHDREILNLIRPFQKPTLYVVNKIEGIALLQSFYEFYQIGVKEIFPISAEAGTGIDDLMVAVEKLFPEESVSESLPEIDLFAKVAVVGRPNVGKSTFINFLLGENRLITSATPGTTRDAIDTLVRVKERNYLFIDTAGIRRRGKIEKGVERASVIRSDESIHKSDIVFILIDGGEGITDQDIKLVGRVIEEGKGFAIIVNKWDLKKEIVKAREKFEKDLVNYFSFIKEFPFLFLSAKDGFDPEKIYKTINEIMASYEKRISTSEINQFLEKILAKFPPPLYRKKPVKINYATQGGTKPPTFIFFTNFKDGVTRSYQKFLENSLRESFGFKGTPVRLLIKQKKNIYKKD
ncbi:MAG: ribosome biogenesis GTPase Der [Nitrospirae bacterium]|nr:ribosome biogenesis GTPase Der [Nitrospirota bacterium]MBI3595439.1 ribosome biogenesis GTPase Der [Nitrospirota bacterium]